MTEHNNTIIFVKLCAKSILYHLKKCIIIMPVDDHVLKLILMLCNLMGGAQFVKWVWSIKLRRKGRVNLRAR